MKKTLLLSSTLFLSSLGHAASFEKFIAVTGQCRKQVARDRVSVELATTYLAKNSETAFNQATGTYEKLRKALLALNLKDAELSTSDISLYEKKEWVNNSNVSRGFEARLSLKVSTSDIKRMTEVMSVANQHKIKEIGQLQSYASYELVEKTKRACLKEAFADAQLKAKEMADSAKVQLGNVLQLSEENASAPTPVMFEAKLAKMASSDAGGGPGIEAGLSEIITRVNASFSIR